MNNKKEKGSMSVHHFHEGENSHLTEALSLHCKGLKPNPKSHSEGCVCRCCVGVNIYL